jgi:hypothetical protein
VDLFGSDETGHAMLQGICTKLSFNLRQVYMHAMCYQSLQVTSIFCREHCADDTYVVNTFIKRSAWSSLSPVRFSNSVNSREHPVQSIQACGMNIRYCYSHAVCVSCVSEHDAGSMPASMSIAAFIVGLGVKL